jgi:biopolymer transport protein ExbB
MLRKVSAWAVLAAAVAAAAPAAAQDAPDEPAVRPVVPADAATRPAGQQRQRVERMSFLELLLKGRWFMIPIGLCSLAGLAIILERLLALRATVVMPEGFMDGLKAAFGPGDRAAALRYARSHDSPLSRVAAAGILKLHRAEEHVEQAIEDAGANEVSKLRRHLRMLYGVAAVAPMLGLLGTVWGMIEAFQVASARGLGRAELLATGIYEALVTTFAGLCVAIPVLIFYYYFLGRVDSIVHRMNELSLDFVEHFTGVSAAEEDEEEGGDADADS